MSNISKSPVSRSTPFDNTVTNWPINPNAQEAIEYARSNAIATVRFCIVTVFNGTMSNNQWCGYSELLPGDSVPIVVPLSCRLKELAVSYNGASVDGRFDLYKNGTAAGDIIDSSTFTFANQANRKVFTGINYTFVSGDQIRMRWVDLGDNPSDVAIVYYFEVTG